MDFEEKNNPRTSKAAEKHLCPFNILD